MQQTYSSGNLIVDRRAHYARALGDGGDHAAAADVMLQALELAPRWAAGWFFFGEQSERAGNRTAALEAYERVLQLSQQDSHGASLKIALLKGERLEKVPHAYSKALFDDYANRFDEALVGRLGYDVPAQLAKLLAEDGAIKSPIAHAVDLGCGTGLMAQALAVQTNGPQIRRFTGVDLSPAMLAKARAKGFYATLIEGELCEIVPTLQPSALITAADVFIYFARLDEVLEAIAANLVPGGLLLFSLEATQGGAEFQLLPSLRHGHSQAYAAKALARVGMKLVVAQPATFRMEAGAPIEGLLCMGRKLND